MAGKQVIRDWTDVADHLCDCAADYGVWSAEEMFASMVFSKYASQFFDRAGLFYRGHNLKFQGWSWMLVLKLAKDNTPYVVFLSHETPLSCMVEAINKTKAGALKLTVDQYA